MQINFSSISSKSFSYLNENIIPSLDERQKRILLVAAVAIACVAALFVFFCNCFKTSEKPGNQPPHDGKISQLAEKTLKEPKLNGNAIYTDQYGNECEGEFFEGILVAGKKTSPDGVFRAGSFKNGYLFGHGKFSRPGHWTHEGEFDNGKLHGRGKASYGKRVDEGEFAFGHLIHGKKSTSNKIEEGDFKHEKLIKGKVTFKDGTELEGEFKDEKLHGKGKITHPDGTSEQGTFVDGIFVKS